MPSDIRIRPKNLRVSSREDEFIQMLTEFKVIQKGHFEYKGKAIDGSRMHGEFFINYRILTSVQEIKLANFYRDAISHWFSGRKNLIIAGVAMGSLILPKVVQLSMYEESGIEYAYTEKRDGILGLYGEQAEKCRGKHILFIEDVCNNGTSSRELVAEMNNKKHDLGITGFSILYGIHRGHMFLDTPENELYAMGMVYAPSYHKIECPACERGAPLKEYKK